ncbi:MAG: succinate dehydrogenase iron-sulfur subunit [Bacillota bacterium]|nr:succinate dehydrogenase iron-sulfur subunit [Bacillota bacterium]
MARESVKLRIRRQENPEATPRWEDFEVPYEPGMNVISALMAIQRNPVNAAGQPTTPVAWESSCLEEVCGACSMVINGRARQACSTLVDKVEEPITLEPMHSFPVVRDLIVDRSRMFENLKKVKAWIPLDGTYPLGPGPRISDQEQQWRYELSRCMTCGVCLEVCPNYGPQSRFIGAQPIAQVVLFNAHPTGRYNADERLDALMEPGGVEDCGNAQNCVRACPKGIPLTTAIAEANRQTIARGFTRWLASKSKSA